ncbi:MAG: hypothetical protein ACLQT5_06035 [Steroidobacteraceae bacterium]|jgi:hypothetical protein
MLAHSKYCPIVRNGFLVAAFLGLAGQIFYDRHLITAVSVFPQWLLLGSLWYLWRRQVNPRRDHGMRDTLILALLIPALSCSTLLIAWLGWKANTLAIGGVIPVSDSASYYISAQTFLREGLLDASGQRRPLNTLLASLWLWLSGDNFKLLLLIQALGFSAAAFLASAAVSALHGFRAGVLLFALLLVFAEPYLPTVLSETNGILFGILSLIGFLCGAYRRRLFAYCVGAFFLAMALAVRPSAVFVLPCVVVAGAVIFGTTRTRRLMAVVCLVGAVLAPVGISFLLNRTMSHHDGAFNGNLSYSVYGLVSGAKGWEQYQKDNPQALVGLPEAERTHIVLQASWRHFKEHPLDLVRGLVKSQVAGPLQTFAQIARLAFLGAAGDPLRIIPPAVIAVISLLFAGVLGCQWVSSRHVVPMNDNLRVFCIWFLIGYLISIPFFYADGGLRLHAAVLPVLSYMLVWVLRPAGALSEDVVSNEQADRLVAATAGSGFLLVGLLGWVALMHPGGHRFDLIPKPESVEAHEMTFLFKPGWPQCDLGNFEHVRGDSRPRWFSGAIPDDDYRSAGIREIAGRGHLYLGFDADARDWKIVRTDQPVGLLNRIGIEPEGRAGVRDKTYRDYYSAASVQIVGAK